MRKIHNYFDLQTECLKCLIIVCKSCQEAINGYSHQDEGQVQALMPDTTTGSARFNGQKVMMFINASFLRIFVLLSLRTECLKCLIIVGKIGQKPINGCPFQDALQMSVW